MSRSEQHILILSSWYPTKEHPFLGNFVQRNAFLLAQSYKVTVLVTEASSELAGKIKTDDQNGVTTVRSYYEGNTNVLARKRNARTSFKKAIDGISDVNLVVGHVLLPKGWQFLSAKKKFNCPLIYIEHGSYFRKESPFLWSKMHRLIRSRIQKKATEIVAVSEYLKMDLLSHFPQREIHVIGNHVDTEVFTVRAKKKSSKTQFLHVSTLDPVTKNPEGIINACALLLERTSDFQMTIICDEDYAEWETLSKHLGLENHIRFIGPIEWHELVPYYHDADAFVLFSNYETFSIVLAEALSTGTPIISTPVGIAHQLPAELGTLVAINNREELMQQMLRFVQGEVHFDDAELKSFANQYSAEVILNQWNTLIQKHLG